MSQDDDSRGMDIEEADVIKFNPSLAIQRYEAVCDLLKSEHIQSAVDFGINTCKSLTFYKSVPSLEQVYGVDVDRAALETGMFLAKPCLADLACPKRSQPLTVSLLCGSVSEYDTRLKGVEAVIMIELIEHLPPECLDAFPAVVFGQLQPNLVVITTPNADFNVLFPNFSGKRHWDHKFEWSRREFQQWCSSVCQQYKYSVEYSGVGDPPSDKINLGFCSQIAVFRSCGYSDPTKTSSDLVEQTYELICESKHPYSKCSVSSNKNLIQEATYTLRQMARWRKQDMTEDDEDTQSNMALSIEQLMEFSRIKHICSDIDQLRSVLEESGCKLSPDRQEVLYCLEDEASDDDFGNDDPIGSDTEDETSYSDNKLHHNIGQRLQLLSTEPCNSYNFTSSQPTESHSEENWDESPKETPPEFEDSTLDSSHTAIITNTTSAVKNTNSLGKATSYMSFIPSFSHAHQGPYSHHGSSFRARTRNNWNIVDDQFCDADNCVH